MAEETGASQEKTFTQAEFEAALGARLARERDKFADYDELKKKADAFDAAQEASKTELEKMRERAEKAEAAVAAADARAKHAALVKQVMQANGVDPRFASLLTAQTEEGLTEQAKLIGQRFAEAVPSDTGKQANVSDPDAAKKQFAHDLFSGRK